MCDFEGPDWDRFATVLAEYGYQVILAWILTAEIYGKCRARGLGGSDIVGPPWQVERSAAESLANETVALAIKGFRDHRYRPAVPVSVDEGHPHCERGFCSWTKK